MNIQQLIIEMDSAKWKHFAGYIDFRLDPDKCIHIHPRQSQTALYITDMVFCLCVLLSDNKSWEKSINFNNGAIFSTQLSVIKWMLETCNTKLDALGRALGLLNHKLRIKILSELYDRGNWIYNFNKLRALFAFMCL